MVLEADDSMASTINKRVICEQRAWPKKMLEHVHNYAQLILPISGTIKIAVREEIDATIHDDVVFVPPQAIHTFCSPEQGEVIVFDILEDWSRQWQDVKGFTHSIDSRWSALKTLVEHELNLGSRDSLQLERLGDYALHLLNLDEPPSIRYIRENFRTSLNISMLADKEHFSIGHYHKWFVRMTGMTPVEYIRKLRMDWATHLLKTTELPIRHIAEEIGYASQATLSRLFLEEVGMSPAAYRKKVREMNKNRT